MGCSSRCCRDGLPSLVSFAGLIPVEIHTADQEQLRRELDEHEANCPGTYQECCTDGRGNLKTGPLERLYRKWAAKKCDLKSRLGIAERLGKPKADPAKKPKAGNPNMVEKIVEQLLESYMQTHNRLLEVGMSSPHWDTIRQNLYNQRRQLETRCKRNGVPMPLVPDMPSKPRAGRCTIPEHLLSHAERQRRKKGEAA